MPKPDPIPRCALIANPNGSDPYIKCQNFDGSKVSGPITRIPIADLLRTGPDGKPVHPEKYICTTDAGYGYFEGVYVPKVERFVSDHCK